MLDGEGSIDWNSGNARIRVAKNATSLLHSLRRAYGGSVNSEPINKRDGLVRRPAYKWTITGKKAVDILIEVRSLLRVKGDKADEIVHKWRLKMREQRRSSERAAPRRYA